MKRLIANNDLIINIIKKYFPDFVKNDYSESDMYKNINKIISDNHIQNISSFINTMKNYFEQCLKNGYCDSDIYNFIEELAEDNNINYNLFIQKVKECGNDYSTFTEDCCFSFANYLLDNNILSNDIGESESYDIAYCTVSEFFKDSSKYQTIFKSLFNECENRIKNKNKFSDAYEELSQVKDNIGDTIKTIQSYDNSSSRFVILNDKYLQDNCDDHMELFEKIANNLGYDNFQEFCEQNPNAQFITGKIENGIAIIETSSGKINANANINNVINILKKNGAKKVYTNTNKGRDNEFMRVAKRLIKLANEDNLYLKMKDFINSCMKSNKGKEFLTELVKQMYHSNEEMTLSNAKQYMIDAEPYIAEDICENEISQYIEKNNLQDVEDDVYNTFNTHALDNISKQEFKQAFDNLNSAGQECYKELLNKKDKVGDTVNTSSNYDNALTRFIYLNGHLKIKQSSGHNELFDDIAKECGYSSSWEYSQDPKNKNANFCSGKIEDGVAIIETGNEIKNINEIISTLKKNGVKKVYTNDNKMGHETNFERVAKFQKITKRLILSSEKYLYNQEDVEELVNFYKEQISKQKKKHEMLYDIVDEYYNLSNIKNEIPTKQQLQSFIKNNYIPTDSLSDFLYNICDRFIYKNENLCSDLDYYKEFEDENKFDEIETEMIIETKNVLLKHIIDVFTNEEIKSCCNEHIGDSYQQLYKRNDKVGDTITLNDGYDNIDNRFVYLDGEYLEGETSDHIELFEKLSKKMGYDNFQEFCEQNPDAKFITGKTKNGIAIVETSSGKVNANANINDVISVLKKNGIKKIYTNDNIGNDNEFIRVAKN